MSGIPIVNVNNNCSTGSSALFLGRQLIAGDIADCVMAIGFEKMEKGSLGLKFTDRRPPMSKQLTQMIELRGFAPSPAAAQVFGNAGREHMERYGTTPEQFAKIGYKNHKHSVNNPYSQFQDEYTLEQIQAAPMVYEPLTKLQCCPTSDGSGAAILASEAFVKSHGLEDQAVEIIGQAMTTDRETMLTDRSCISLAGADMTRQAAQKVYEESGLGPEDVDVIELHDCFSANEMITYEALGLCHEGQGRSAHRRWRRHLRRRVGREPVRRPDLQGPPAGRHRPGAVRRAHLAAARSGRQAPGGRRHGRSPAQPRAGRRRRRHHVPQAGGQLKRAFVAVTAAVALTAGVIYLLAPKSPKAGPDPEAWDRTAQEAFAGLVQQTRALVDNPRDAVAVDKALTAFRDTRTRVEQLDTPSSFQAGAEALCGRGRARM